MKKVEFHIHTRRSHDSLLSTFFIMIMCKLRKIDCVAICDHNQIEMAINKKNYLERHHINVIVGEEVFTTEGEIIGLFLNEKIPANLTPEETVFQIKKQGGLVYIPHPYDEKRYKTVLNSDALERIIDDVDFIECHNGRNISPMFSKKQNAIAEKYKKVKVVGSDAHCFFEIGRNYIMLESIEKEALLTSVKRGEMVCNPCLKFAHFWTKVARVYNKIFRGGIENEI